MELATLQGLTRLVIKQRFTLMVNRYEVWAADSSGRPTAMVALAQQKRMAMREQVNLYHDEARTSVLVGFKARQVIDLGATYDVTDEAGRPLGNFRKDFARSLLRSTWHLEQPGLPALVGEERDVVIALLRRFVAGFLPYHFDFTSAGAPAFSVEKRWGIRDTYEVTITNPQVDRRLVIAMAVALDALQAR
jgi:uncharacterized protein YxjI